MAKAPAFQFYAADFLTDTSDWTPEEVGVFIRLLSTQWINGSLPKEMDRLARISGTAVATMVEIWLTLGCKFVEGPDGKLFNPKLEEIRHQRENFLKKQSEKGKKSAARRKNEPRLEQRLIRGYNTGSNSVATENQPLEDEVEEEIEGEEGKEEMGDGVEEGHNPYLIPAMLVTWKKNIPTYPEDHDKDYPALLALSEFICKQAKAPYNPRDGGCMSLILTQWEKWAVFVSKHDFFKRYSLAQVNTHSQNILQSIEDGKHNGRQSNQNGQNQQPRGTVISDEKEFGKL